MWWHVLMVLVMEGRDRLILAPSGQFSLIWKFQVQQERLRAKTTNKPNREA